MSSKNTEQLDLLPANTPAADLIMHVRDKQRGQDFRLPFAAVGGNPATNTQPGGPFLVTHAFTTDPGYTAGQSTLDTQPNSLLCLGSLGMAEFGPAGARQLYVLVYDPLPRPAGTGLQAFRDGTATGNQLPAKWVLLYSPVASTPAYTQLPAGFPFTLGFLVRAVPTDDPSTERFFSSNFAGTAPAGPTVAAGDANWTRVDETTLPPAFSPATNDQPGGPFRVTNRYTADANYTAGNTALDGLPNARLCINAPATVEFGPDANDEEYVVKFDGAPRAPGTGMQAFKDGTCTGATLPAKWVRRADVRAFTPYGSVPASYSWAAGQYASHYVGSPLTEQFFKARTAGPHPAPTLGGDVTHWEPSSFTEVPAANQPPISQTITLAAAQRLAADGQGIEPIYYRILRGSGGSPAVRRGDVVVLGIAQSPATTVNDGDVPAQFATVGLWLDPAIGKWRQVFYEVLTDTVTPVQLEQIIVSAGGIVFGLSPNQSVINTNAVGDANTIFGGDDNSITGPSGYSSISGGIGNLIAGGFGCSILGSDGSIIPSGCSNVALINCTNFTAPVGSNKTYINNVEVGGATAPYVTATDVEITDPTKGIIMPVGAKRVRAQITGTTGAYTWTFTEL